MSSPFLVAPFSYGDLVDGGSLAPIIFAGRIPTSQDIKPAGYFWLSDQTLGGSGALYYQSGFIAGAPNWVLIGSGAAGSFTSVTATGAISAGTTLAAGTTVTGGTGVTATTGNLTASNGNLSLGTAGNKVIIATGTNASIGTSAAMTAGAVTVATTAITASSKVFVSAAVAGGTQGTLRADPADYIAGTSFVIRSSNAADTSTVNWWIIN